MALPTDSVDVTGTLSWTRGEFSSNSRTLVYESTTNVFADSSLVADVPSSTVSRSFTKSVQKGTTVTRYYWVRHKLATGTLGATAGPVTGAYTASGGLA